MFSRNSTFRQHSSRAKAATVSDPLTATSQEQVVGAINQMGPAADDSSAAHRQRSVSGRHEVLKELKSSAPAQTTESLASSTKSFPSTGLSRSRKASAPVLSRTVSRESPKPPMAGEESVEGLLPHDSLGRRMWQHFQAAAEQSDLRDMIADSPTGILVLPTSTAKGQDEPDFEALLNDNVLFTETVMPEGADPGHKRKFTTASGICGTVDRGSVSALGVLPPMEDLMQAVGETDLPRTTLFDVLDANVMAGPPLQRLRIVQIRRECRLPDSRHVQVVVTSGPLERRLVVDSAVTTLSARIYDAVDATFGALLPQAPEPLTASDQVKVDIEDIMRFAHAVELRASSSRGAKDTSAGRRALAWIAGQKPAKSGSPLTAASSLASSSTVDADAETWQLRMAQFQDHVMDHLAKLENETSMCGDAESRRKICSGLLECVEKLAMESLYPRIFSPSVGDDRAQDEQFASKVAALNMAGITLEHLGLNTPLAANNELMRICAEAGRLLDRVDSARSPAEKLKLIVDAHKCVVDRMQTLNERLRRAEQPADEGEHETSARAELSADSILPLMIFAVVKSNPSRFISNLRFIQRFRTRSLLASEFEYCMTNAQAVASFVGSVDARKLGLSAEVSSGALERAMPPALTALHNLLVNNVVSSVGIDVVQGVAGGGRKVAVNVYDATLGRLIDSSSHLMAKAPWRSPEEERELQPGGAATNEQQRVISGVRDVLNSASRQLSYEIKGHLPRSRASPAQAPQIVDRFLHMDAGDLRVSDISQLLASYKELARFVRD
ncbi:hypothetical protein LPJ63_001949 [Coemansia sp. RSA 2711]|nr:hypothetical protein LPJ63_001949 [Coemansia sp. RSA 2711]